jgi:hypothetical protein
MEKDYAEDNIKMKCNMVADWIVTQDRAQSRLLYTV